MRRVVRNPLSARARASHPLGNLAEAGRQALNIFGRGTAGAVEEGLATAADVADASYGAAAGLAERAGFEGAARRVRSLGGAITTGLEVAGDGVREVRENVYTRPQHWSEELASGFVQAATGFVLLRRAGVSNMALNGMLVDAAFFDPHEKRLSNLAAEMGPDFARPLFEFMAASEDDPALVARLKAGLEGLVIGESLARAISWISSIKWGRKAAAGGPEAEQAADRARRHLEDLADATPDADQRVVARQLDDETWTIAEIRRRPEQAAPTEAAGGVLPDQPGDAWRIGDNLRHHGDTMEELLPLQGGDPDAVKLVDVGEGTHVAAYYDEAGELAGYLQLHEGPNGWEVMDVMVRPDQRRKGVSMRLAEAAQTASGRELVTGVTPQSPQGARFSEAMRRRGMGRNPFLDSGEDVVEEIAEDAPRYSTQAQAEGHVAGIEELRRATDEVTQPVDDKTVESVLEVARRIREGADPNDLERLLDGLDFNFSAMNAAEDAASVIEAISELLPEGVYGARLGWADKLRGRSVTNETTTDLAQRILKENDESTLIGKFARMWAGTVDLPQRIVAARIFLHFKTAQAARLGKMVDMDPTNEAAYQALRRVWEGLEELHGYASGTSTNIGRSLQAHQIDIRAASEGLETGSRRSPGRAAPDGTDAAPGRAAPEEPSEAPKPTKADEDRANAIDELLDAVEEAEAPLPSVKATEGLVTNDVTLAKRRSKIERLLKVLEDEPDAWTPPERFREARKRHSERLKEQADKQRSEPVSITEGQEARAKQLLADASEPSDFTTDMAGLLEQADNRLTKEMDQAVNGPPPKKPKSLVDQEASPLPDLLKKVDKPRGLDALERLLKQADDRLTKEMDRAVNGPPKPKPKSLVDQQASKNPIPALLRSGRPTKEELRAMARQLRLQNGQDPEKVLAALFSIRKQHDAERKGLHKLVEAAHSVRVEAMLSAGVTHLTNVVTALGKSLHTPTKMVVGGLMPGGDKALSREGWDTLVGLYMSAWDSAKIAGRTLRSGINELDRYNTKFDTINDGIDEALAKWKVPSRLMLAGDEFVKQMNYRARVRAQSLRLSREEGVTDGAEIASRLADDMKAAFRLDNTRGGATNATALQYTRDQTWTTPLENGSLGKKAQEFAREHAVGRLLLPFVRTPTNIMIDMGHNTPGVNLLYRKVREDIAAGGERAAMRYAEMAMGGAFYTTAFTLAHAGQLTGAGPTDPDLRRQWLAMGNQPYSIRLPGTDQWISYRRADPMLAPLGFAANMYQMAGEMTEEDRKSLTSYLGAYMASSAEYVMSKGYMQSMADFLEALNSGEERQWEAFLKSTATSFVPNAVARSSHDTVYREVDGVIDAMMSRIPGLSQTLEPRRNFFGEKVMKPPGWMNRAFNPFTVASPEDRELGEALMELGRPFSMPSETLANGNIDLRDRDKYREDGKPRQSPYDRWMELIANPSPGVPSLKESIQRLVDSPQWEQWSRGTNEFPGGMRWEQVNARVQQYRNMAWAQLLSEYPKLHRDAVRFNVMQGAAVMGGQQAQDRAEQFFQ